MERFDRLTPRQRECLRLVARGYSSKQIALQLRDVTHNTVRNHIAAALVILEIGDRAEAARRLVDFEADARRTSDVERLVSTSSSRDDQASEVEPVVVEKPPFLPPIGGTENQIATRERVWMIARMTIVALLAVLACAIIAKVGLAILS